MAETVKVEIAIAATDNTAMGISSVQGKLNALDRSFQKIQRQIDKLTGSRCKVDLDAHDNASDKIADVDDALQKTNGREANIDVGANDGATGILNSVEGTVDELNGEGAVVEAEAEDAATGVLSDVEGTLSELNGETAVVEAEAEDAASGTIDEVEQKVNALDGSSATVLIQAENQAEGAIRDAAGAARAPIAETAAVMGASFGVYDSISTFAGFEAGMSQVAAISGATGAELDALTAKAKQMGASTKFTATESAEAFNYMAMAGWKTDDMLGGIEGVMNLAAASGESLATTSDIVTDALTAFGMKASDSTHFADVMAQASANANTNVGMLGESFKYVAPVAGAMGYTIEDTALALGLMANAGVKSSMAGTALRRAISALTSPTDKQANAMEKYGISLTNSDGSIKSLNEVMGDLRTNLSGLSEDEKTAAVSQMFGSQAMAGMLAIINASEDDFNKMSDAVSNAEGAAKSMADTMLDNLQGSFTLMQSAIEGVENSLGERLAPYMKTLADSITSAMPDAKQALSDLMDKVDELAGKVNRTFRSMISSDEWKNADFLGKVDIAWDTLIAQPFATWAETDGVNMIAGGLKTMFGKALKVLPGGEEAGLTDWIAAGIFGKIGLDIAKVAPDIISGVESIVGSLNTLPSCLGPAMLTAAGLGLAIGAIKLAVDRYNKLTVQNNLEEHFGNLHLNAEEAQQFADQVTHLGEVVEKLNEAQEAYRSAEKLKLEAENKLNEIGTLQWKITNVQFDTSEMDLEALQTASGELRDILIEKLKLEEEGDTSFIQAILGNSPKGAEIISTISGWFEEDASEVSSISSSITSLLQRSINEGVESIETATAVSILQAKMMEITNGTREAELQGQLEWLKIKSSGAALDPESWAAVVEEIGIKTNEFMEKDASAYQSFLGSLWKMEKDHPERKEMADSIRKIIADAQGELKNTSTLNGWNWMYEALNESYGGEIEQAKGVFGDYNFGVKDEWGLSGRENLEAAIAEFQHNLPEGTAGALKDRFEKMMPTAEALEKIIDESTGPVPEAIMKAYDQAVELAALSGDQSALDKYWAQMLRESGEYDSAEAAKAAMEEQGVNVSEGMQAALERAFHETAKDMDYGNLLNDIFANLAETDIDWNEVSRLLQEAGYEIDGFLAEKGLGLGANTVGENGGINHTPGSPMEITETDQHKAYRQTADRLAGVMESSGSEVELTTNGIQVTLGEVEVDEQSAASQLSEALGMSMSDLSEMTGLSEEELEAGGMTITIPPDGIEVNTPDLEEATQAAMDGEPPIQTTRTATAVIEETEVDASSAYSEAAEETQGEFDQPMEPQGAADVTLTQTNNADEVYSGVEKDVQSRFDSAIPAHGRVNVTLKWHITNPSANISVSTSGSTATATIGSAAMANGGFVNGAILSWIGEAGPEYVIPVGAARRGRGAELWAQAGEALGMFDGAEDAMLANPFETNNSTVNPLGSLLAAAGSPEKGNGDTTNGVNVNVSMSPVIQIDGSNMNEDDIFNVMKRRIKECADDVGYEVGEKLAKIFSNMPLAQGV